MTVAETIEVMWDKVLLAVILFTSGLIGLSCGIWIVRKIRALVSWVLPVKDSDSPRPMYTEYRAAYLEGKLTREEFMGYLDDSVPPRYQWEYYVKVRGNEYSHAILHFRDQAEGFLCHQMALPIVEYDKTNDSVILAWSTPQNYLELAFSKDAFGLIQYEWFYRGSARNVTHGTEEPVKEVPAKFLWWLRFF